MTKVGQKEKATQARVLTLFQKSLGYTYLGSWIDRPNNSNIDEPLLREFLANQQGYNQDLITRALHHFTKTAADASKTLYDRNRAVYELLRYGIKVKPDVGEHTETVWLIDWKNPNNNHFGVAEEVAVQPVDPNANGKRPDIVLYVNGIALVVLELKRSTVSVNEGIRQQLDNQKKMFIPHFFSTAQWLLAGNDIEGVRYGTIQTPQKYYLTWKDVEPQDQAQANPLDSALLQLCSKERLLTLIHDFIVFDAGTKKLCRHNQYFGVRAAQDFVKRREGGIIWHTQGSGKSLTMVWLAKWIRENVKDGRVLIITDRTELDDQIEGVFKGVNEDIYRTKSGRDLTATLNATTPWLLCSLVHKFGTRKGDDKDGAVDDYIAQLKKSLPKDFKAKGNLFVFVDECHRTQSGNLHKAMKTIVPEAVFIGFTGTPLLKSDKKKSLEVFGRYIHTYKFDEAVQDGVVLDLRYEARDIDQRITSQAKIDEWFEVNTAALTDLAKAQLKQRWGTMQKVLSSKSRLDQIVADILMDMAKRDRLKSGKGNALLVAGSIYEACKFYELFSKTGLAGKCAIVTSYVPGPQNVKGEETGEGVTETLEQYDIYQQMLAAWFDEAPGTAIYRVAEFEQQAKQRFVKEPGQLKLLIVVDKLLTGFDAPPATYLYIDKHMRDHGLFQAICRVNRLDGDDKEYGYVVDYKDLFKSLETAVTDYTSQALDGFDEDDVAGLLKDRVGKAKERLEEARETVKALCEPVEPPKDSAAYLAYFCAKESGNAEQLKESESRRLALYRHVAALVRAYANLAGELIEAGYTPEEVQALRLEVTHFESVRGEIKIASGDAIDLKRHEPAMRHLIDTYIQAQPSEKVSEFDDLSLVELIVRRGPQAVDALPEGIRKNQDAVAETIENNVRRVIVDEHPVNPKYYEKMSELLDALIKRRKEKALAYEAYLQELVKLTKQVKDPAVGGTYPKLVDTPAKRALYDNFGRDESLSLGLHNAIMTSRMDDWRNNPFKVKKVRLAVMQTLDGDDELAHEVVELAKAHDEY